MDKSFWDSRYAEDGFAYGIAVNEFLSSFEGAFKAGQKVLVIGDGEGRNGVWLAEQGCHVVSVDSSNVGVKKAQELASEKGVEIEAICADLNDWTWPESEFDFVVIIYVHFPPEVRAFLHQKVISALKPGGQLIMESFSPAQLHYSSGGPPVLEMLYTADMMQDDFKLLEIQQLEECVIELNEGKYHCGEGAVVRLVAKKS
ncbi:MAG: class I SAM-dependent methyltransferase [Gammaproteobacteria bacterium]|nr:class I SAM-dependent methyltransferase [Gammaproteobacteria bacterium]MCW8988006.1 class I SAM-dependent methyltransferase [Gammaproteobacteria bacterium]MCW9032007.1 class I SAM-dependent methyltransferase [Gammaproteobacteria bacterium]